MISDFQTRDGEVGRNRIYGANTAFDVKSLP